MNSSEGQQNLESGDVVEPAANEAQPAEKSTLEPFFRYLAENSETEDVVHRLRVTAKGMFLDESLSTELLKHYQSWCETNQAHVPSYDKALKRLFQTETPELFYLIEGKHCLVGFFVEQALANPQNTRIPLYQGSLQTAKGYLHPRDPLFTSDPRFQGQWKSTGFELQIQAGKHQNSFDLESLRQFGILAETSRDFQKLAPGAGQALRRGLPGLLELLQKIRPVRGKGVLIPASLRNQKDLHILSYRNIVVIKSGERVLKMYDLGGKNLSHFLKQELEQIRSNPRLRKIGSLQVFEKLKGFSFASVQTRHDRFSVELSAFKGFLLAAVNHKELSKKFCKPYTTFDGLRVFSEIAEKSQRIEARDVPKHILEDKPADTRIRQSGDWIILMNSRNVAFYCTDKNLPRNEKLRPKSGGKSKSARRSGAAQKNSNRKNVQEKSA